MTGMRERVSMLQEAGCPVKHPLGQFLQACRGGTRERVPRRGRRRRQFFCVRGRGEPPSSPAEPAITSAVLARGRGGGWLPRDAGMSGRWTARGAARCGGEARCEEGSAWAGKPGAESRCGAERKPAGRRSLSWRGSPAWGRFSVAGKPRNIRVRRERWAR